MVCGCLCMSLEPASKHRARRYKKLVPSLFLKDTKEVPNEPGSDLDPKVR